MGNPIAGAIRNELMQNSDEKTIESAKRFFKEETKWHGVKSSQVLKISKEYTKRTKDLGKKEIFPLCEELLKSDYGEESFIAFDLAYSHRNDFSEDDFRVFESWVKKYVNNWAKCDTLCNHTIAAIVEKYPKFLGDLKAWTKSENRWVKRAAAVTLVLPARNGKFHKEIFEIADSLLLDKDDMVQKGYGWMLKEASKADQKAVFDYVMEHRKVMPRTALRYAIEKMPEDLKKKAMEKGG